MIGLLLLVMVLAMMLYAFYRWATINKDYFKLKNIASLRPTFLLGNTGGFFMKLYRTNEYVANLYNSFPDEKFFGMFDFRTPLYMIRDPALIKRMAIKDFDHFVDHKFLHDPNFDDVLSKTLFVLRGETWRHMRATLSPAFTGSKMRQMFALVGECADNMTETLRRRVTDRGEELHVSVKELFGEYTMDVIASTVFGIKVNSFDNKENEFLINGKKILNANNLKQVIKILFLYLFPRLSKWYTIEIFDPDVTTFFKSMVVDTMNERQAHNIVRPDMINMLMQLRKGNNTVAQPRVDASKEDESQGFAAVDEHEEVGQAKIELTDEEIVAQCFLFFVAGYDTTSSVLSFISYELALNPDVQERLFNECKQNDLELNGKALSYDMLQRMKYMDQVVCEGLRKWPPSLNTDRMCNKHYELDDGDVKLVIEKGTQIWIPIYGLHHDEKYFPSPETFQPERFSDENKGNVVPGSYIPFGVGPRNCIASRFALMEVKSLLYHLVLNFRMEPNEKTQIPLKLAKNPLGVVTERGIHLKLILRTHE